MTKPGPDDTSAAPMNATEEAVRRWLDDVVIGLKLCPFAARPRRRGQVRIVAYRPRDEEQLCDMLQSELEYLANTPAAETETTLLAIETLLGDFEDYQRFVDFAEVLLSQFGWRGVFQLASFHPDYQFAGTAPDDAENLTNRSPCPILHLIREESLAHALAHFPDPERIPEINIARVKALDTAERRRLFPYLFGR